MRHYELVTILSPMLSQDQAAEAWGQISAFITSRNGDIFQEQPWGTRRLAYAIHQGGHHFLEGNYRLTRFSTETPFNQALENFLRLDERVLRSLVVTIPEPQVLPDPVSATPAAPATVPAVPAAPSVAAATDTTAAATADAETSPVAEASTETETTDATPSAEAGEESPTTEVAVVAEPEPVPEVEVDAVEATAEEAPVAKAEPASGVEDVSPEAEQPPA